MKMIYRLQKLTGAFPRVMHTFLHSVYPAVPVIWMPGLHFLQ
jgi:hypothetical protein